jgi:hypothetical protein
LQSAAALMKKSDDSEEEKTTNSRSRQRHSSSSFGVQQHESFTISHMHIRISNLPTTTLMLTAHRISHININLTSHSVQVKKRTTHCVEYSQQIQHARNRRHGRTVHFLFCCSMAFIKLRRRNLHAHQKRPQYNRSSIVQPQATGSALCNKTPDELKRRK